MPDRCAGASSSTPGVTLPPTDALPEGEAAAPTPGTIILILAALTLVAVGAAWPVVARKR